MATEQCGEFTISRVTAADVPAVIDHVKRTLSEFGIVFGVGATTDADLFELPQSYDVRGGAFWIARSASGELAGCAGITPVGGGDYELRKMYLSPITRGKGLGRALLDRTVAFARVQGAKRVVLDTVDQMQSAIAFYERNGFVRDDSQIRGSRCTRGYALAT